MVQNRFRLIIFFIIISVSAAYCFGNELDKNNPDVKKVWLFFKDKGPQSASKLLKPGQLLTERSLQRRLKVKSEGNLVTQKDLPVYRPYIHEIVPHIRRLRAKSKWLNAISVEVESANISILHNFDFISKITPVIASKRRGPQPSDANLLKTSSPVSAVGEFSLDYGESFTQLNQITVPALHELGLYGQGVLICLLDGGFDLWDKHIAFNNMDIVDVWDFAENDGNIYGSSHGTKTLSTIGGYTPGDLIGPAFQASYLLARTEVVATETPVEEDYWVAGLEWADSLGADIVSSSLGYSEFDLGYDSYTYEDMDGETAVTTIAADMAVDNGMLVVNSAGNEGNSSWKYITAPADGNNVLAIGAVYDDNSRVYFSSLGPTFDGRVKPDLAAMGYSVRVASTADSTSFTYSNGTSFSCPLAAGSAALLLTAYPYLTPFEIHEVMRSTASQAANPDTMLGWGIIDIEAAYYMIDTSVSPGEFGKGLPVGLEISANYPNPFNPSTKIDFRLSTAGFIEVDIFNITGQRILNYNLGYRERLKTHHAEITFPSGSASGVYFFRINAVNAAKGLFSTKTGKMIYIK